MQLFQSDQPQFTHSILCVCGVCVWCVCVCAHPHYPLTKHSKSGNSERAKERDGKSGL